MVHNEPGQLPFIFAHLFWVIARPKRRITIKDLDFLNKHLKQGHFGILSSNVRMTKSLNQKSKITGISNIIKFPKL